MIRRDALLLGGTWALIVLAAAGCDRGPELARVAGTVKFDGAPLDDARIEFDALNGSPSTVLPIEKGAFSGDVIVGQKTVRFFALRPSKPNPRLGPTDVQNPVENVLPDKYGYDSELTLKVGGSESDEALHFELTSK